MPASPPSALQSKIAWLTNAFSIGGSKCGALCCEAVLVKDAGLRRDFLQLMRVRGALMSKARLAGVQYAALFEDGLYESIGKQAVAYARKIRRMLEDRGVEPHGKSPTNQQFFVFSDRQARHFAESGIKLEECFRLPGGRVVMRICTAWSTTRAQFEALKAAIGKLPK
ncbi:MAG: hypothetical protein HUK26_00775 [Duodenibacillus sp.]|nr:hypothetical protein [Duodenibacillus sp.]